MELMRKYIIKEELTVGKNIDELYDASKTIIETTIRK
jgi:hypothetical protein